MNYPYAFSSYSVWLALAILGFFVVIPVTATGSITAVTSLQEQALNSMELGNLKDAEKSLERALRLDSKNANTWEMFANLRASQGLNDQASIMAAKAASLRESQNRLIPKFDLSELPEVVELPDEQYTRPNDSVGAQAPSDNNDARFPGDLPTGNEVERPINNLPNPNREHVDSYDQREGGVSIDRGASRYAQQQDESDDERASRNARRQGDEQLISGYSERYSAPEIINTGKRGRKIVIYRFTDEVRAQYKKCGYRQCRNYDRKRRDPGERRRATEQDDSYQGQ